MHRLGLALAWLLVASAATALTWGVLSSADRETTGRPLTVALTVADTPPSDTSISSVPSSSTSLPSPGLPTEPNSSVTTVPASPTSTVPSPTTTTSAATAPSTSTSSTTTAPSGSEESAWTKLTVPSGGGVVVVSHRPEEVRLESATPSPGFTMEIDKAGPDEVEVEFESSTAGFEVQVRWEDGVLDTQIVSK